ncbi:MAG: hypothetical protein ACOC95_06485 [Planctomycetota bacterium]
MADSPDTASLQQRLSWGALRLRRKAAGWASTRPGLILPVLRLFDTPPEATAGAPAFRAGTELVIEGFPRCANTFAVIAFQLAQPRPAALAHHVHMPAQVIAAARRGTPALVLIREPLAACRSYLVRCPYFKPADALNDYVRFYEAVLDYRQDFVTATFEQVTGDFGRVIDRINARFGTSFRRFKHTDANSAAVFDHLESINRGRRASKKVNEQGIARPSGSRGDDAAEAQAALTRPEHRSRVRRAEELYETYRRLAQTGHHD